MSFEWIEHAACVGMPVEWFYPFTEDEPGTEGLSGYEIKEQSIANLTKGLDVCASCPVVSECLEDGRRPLGKQSGSGDMPAHFTVRGGMPPLGVSMNNKGRPRNEDRTPEQRIAMHVTAHGHEPVWHVPPKSKPYCKLCERERKLAKELAKSEARGPAPSHKETHGHEPEWRKERTGRQYCRECSNIRLREHRARKKHVIQ